MAILNTLPELNLELLLKTRKGLISAIALAGAALVMVVLAYGQVPGILATHQRLTVEEQKLGQLTKKAGELEQLKFSPEFAQADEINNILPSHKPLLELLNNLNVVAGETGISITQFEINPGEIASDSTQASGGRETSQVTTRRAGSDYDQLDLELDIRGDLDQVRRFMELIEQVSPITTITSLSLERTTASDSDPTIATRATLALSAYYYTRPITSTLSSALPEVTAEERRVFQAILSFTPPSLEEQTTIIGGNATDLFGINGLNVSELEETLQQEETVSP